MSSWFMVTGQPASKQTAPLMAGEEGVTQVHGTPKVEDRGGGAVKCNGIPLNAVIRKFLLPLLKETDNW